MNKFKLGRGYIKSTIEDINPLLNPNIEDISERINFIEDQMVEYREGIEQINRRNNIVYHDELPIDEEIQREDIINVTPIFYDPQTFSRVRGILYNDGDGNVHRRRIDESHPLWEQINSDR